MKKCFLLFIIGILFIGCATTGKPVFQITSNTGNSLTFREMTFEHDLISGETTITLYGLPDYFKKYLESGSSTLYDDYFSSIEQFTYQDEGFNTDKGVFSYRLLLKAKISLLQNENVSVILSKILNREVIADYIQAGEMTKDAVRPWAISFSIDNKMYFINGNSTAVYQNKSVQKVLYIFDLSKNRLELGAGYY